MNEPTSDRLISLYQRLSKHSNYQVLPSQLTELIPAAALTVNSRHERARMDFISQYVDFQDKSVVDVGGNTGYFTFESLGAGADHVEFVEGNSAHCEFVSEAAAQLKVSNRITTLNRYFDFKDDTIATTRNCDIMLLLNVLHHIGDDFGSSKYGKSDALLEIARHLQSTSRVATTLVFQLGFNWKGDRNECLFDRGTKLEMIQFIEQAVEGTWDIVAIGIASRSNGIVTYSLVSETNMERDEALGEFLNRPLFILKKSPNLRRDGGKC